MKIKNLLSVTCCVALLAFSACSNDEEPNFGGLDQKYIMFDAAIEKSLNAKATKAASTTWAAGDAIGVYMKAAGANISASSNENVKYTTAGTGTFSAASTGIEFPSDGSNVDFIAYYPYQESITNYTYPINVSNQSDLAKIDLLYSNNAANTNKSNPAVGLNFKHKLSQQVLNITAGDGVSSLTGLRLSISGLVTEGSFDLSTGNITKGTDKSVLTPVVDVSSATATVNAILIPGEDLNNGKLTFTLNGKVYEWTPDAQVLESGKKYTYSIQLTTIGVVVVNPAGTIEDWNEGNTGGSGIVLTPSEGDVFTSDKAAMSLAAASSNGIIQLTTQSAEAWTASSDQTWLAISPASGTGSTSITATATENTGAERSATVTLTPTSASLSHVTIMVTQAAGTVTPIPIANLVFAGSDFEDWTAFTGGLNTYGLQTYAAQSTNGGRNGSSALHISGTPTGNDYVFTAQANATTHVPAAATKIVLYLKGTATGKSLSFNVYDTAAAGGYHKFNLGDCTADVNVTSSASNSYTGSINTAGQWVKVSLDITQCNLSTTGNVFALKVGKDTAFDLYVDDITFE